MYLPFFTCFGTLIFLSSMILSNAADTISSAQSIRDGETLVSASQRFQLGFFTPGKSNKRYLGIWYEFSPSTVVWVANGRNPITDGKGVLVMSDDGELLLLNNNQIIIWSTNSSKVTRNPVAQLLDSGNFVLRDTSSDSYVWQSFDYPSDTLLSSMKVGWNLRTGFERYLTAWKSDDDPSPGDFRVRLDIQGIPQLVMTIGSKKLARSGPWNGQQFVGVPVLNTLVFKPMVVHKQDELFFTYEPANNTVITRVLLNQAGIQRFVWNWNSKEWIMLYHWPIDACDTYAECGPNQICRNSKTPICECLKGFAPEEEDVWDTSSKCIEKLPAECPSGERFLRLSRTKVPDGYWSNTSMNLKECEAKCYKNCSCKAYANSDVREGGSGCLMWFGELIDIRECSGGFSWGQDFYLRVPASELDYERSKLLVWRKRFDIIIGIARGLFYLHQDSKLQVIHRDLKTSNILLDNDFNPKISDFGLTRIFSSDEKERNTNRVVGTYDYMSPEYAVDGTFSLKSDVFSFGVLLLEVVSGKKNRGFFHPNNHRSLLGHA